MAKSPDFLCEENGRNDSLERGLKKGETFGTSENTVSSYGNMSLIFLKMLSQVNIGV